MWRVLGFTFVFLISSALDRGIAQEPDNGGAFTREQWKAKIALERQRVQRQQQLLREGRSLSVPQPPTQDQLDTERVKRALTDPSLIRGDIIATRRGLYQYRGSPDREPQPGDFVVVPR